MFKRRGVFSVLIFVVAGCLPEPQNHNQATQSSLPAHQVASNSAIYNGRRIEIHVQDSGLSENECRELIDNYRPQAAPNGQVSVRKPNESFGGGLWPWCVDNFDGRGVTFNW